jgi:hypothetical protein
MTGLCLLQKLCTVDLVDFKRISNAVLLFWTISRLLSLLRAPLSPFSCCLVPLPAPGDESFPHVTPRLTTFIRPRNCMTGIQLAREFYSPSRTVRVSVPIFILPVTIQTFTSPRKQIFPCCTFGHTHTAKHIYQLLIYLSAILPYVILKICWHLEQDIFHPKTGLSIGFGSNISYRVRFLTS